MQGHIADYGPRHTVVLTLLRYGVAVSCVVVGLTLARWLQSVLEPETLLLASILIAAWFAGFWPALGASLVATLTVDYYFTPPLHTVTLEIAHVPRLIVFALVAVSFATASAARRTAEHALKTARDEMEAKVHQRTAELRQSNEQLRRQANLLEQSHDAIFVWEFPRTIVYWNRGSEQLYGFSREEAIGRPTHELLRTEHPIATPLFEAALENDGEWAGELTHTTGDGRKIVVESRQVLVRETDGRRYVLETNRDITERKQSEQALEALAGRLIHAQEQERSRIGRELHDHISQMLGVLTIKIDQLRANGSIPAGIANALEEVRRDTSEITDDVHRLSHRLHSSTLDYLGLVPALQKLVSEFSERHDISIAFAHASLPSPLPSDIALCLFRIAEECLTNIAKHSKASSAQVQVTGGSDGIHLTVEDGGTGFDTTTLESKAGLGFVSMQERLRVLHGTIRIDSAPLRGTRITAWVPPMHLQTSGAATEVARGGEYAGREST
jgi:PAS domain S-box-containing protein